MLSDDQLGEILRGELHALVSDIQPTARLMQQMIQPPQSGPRRWLRPRVAVPAFAAIAVIGAIVVLLLAIAGSRPSPVLAFTASSGRSVRVSLNEIAGVTQANAKLRVLGHVRVVAMTDRCKTSTAGINYLQTHERPMPHISLGRPPTDTSATTTVVAAKQTAPNRVILAIGSVTGNVPTCVSSHGTGPGFPGWHPDHTRATRNGTGR